MNDHPCTVPSPPDHLSDPARSHSPALLLTYLNPELGSNPNRHNVSKIPIPILILQIPRSPGHPTPPLAAQTNIYPPSRSWFQRPQIRPRASRSPHSSSQSRPTTQHARR